jgi:hypothetical protein
VPDWTRAEAPGRFIAWRVALCWKCDSDLGRPPRASRAEQFDYLSVGEALLGWCDGETLDGAHADAFVEADGAQVLRVDFQLGLFGVTSLEGAERVSKERLGQSGPTPRLVDDQVFGRTRSSR